MPVEVLPRQSTRLRKRHKRNRKCHSEVAKRATQEPLLSTHIHARTHTHSHTHIKLIEGLSKGFGEPPSPALLLIYESVWRLYSRENGKHFHRSINVGDKKKRQRI